MKELDFDELDRAVNSLMSSVPKSAPVKNDDVKVLTLDTKLPEDTKVPAVSPASPAQTTEAPAQTVETSPQPEPAKTTDARSAAQVTSLASRRGGRFMDVVHPSSDMTKATPAPASTPARGVSRQGLTIEPRPGTSASVAPATSTAPATAPVETMSAPASVEESKEATTPANDWPDPLDLSTPPSPTVDVQEAEVVVASEASTDSFAADPIEPQAPLTSPFLADAKVEKRPLGGAPSAADVQHTEVEEPDHSPVLGVMAQDSPDDDETDSQLPPDPVEADVPLPEELRDDLMAIESDSQPVEPAPETALAVPEAASSSAPAAPIAETAVPTGPSSIPQQYKEEPSTGDQTSGAIFDTAAYHQPLSHPAKKNSSWLWIISVLVILLLGAAGGAALYFLGIV